MKQLDYVDAVIRSIGAELNRFGFRRRGNQLEADRADAKLLVTFQRGRTETTRDQFTVTVGVNCKRLSILAGEQGVPRGIYECHWNMRLGATDYSTDDKWWHATIDAEVQAAINEIKHLLIDVALPAMESLASTDALAQLWRAGPSPGLTDHQRLEYLKILDRDLKGRLI